MIREAVILTKSSMHGGFCVAGIDLITGEWIRFVSSRTGTPLSVGHLLLKNGEECEPLDVVAVHVIGPAQVTGPQTENYLVDLKCLWEKIDARTIQNVLNIHPVEVSPYLYGNLLPYVVKDGPLAFNFDYSLTLIQVFNLVISHPKKTRASFLYNGRWYQDIAVTDPNYYGVDDGARIPAAHLVVSLAAVPLTVSSGEERYYKFIAKIFPQDA